MIRNSINMPAQWLLGHLPGLGRSLVDAGIGKGSVAYLSESIMMASAAGILAFAASALALIAADKPSPELSCLLAAASFAFILALRIHKPAQLMKARAVRIERSLVFGLHAFSIELESGIGLGNAFADVAERDYGEFSLELRRILGETHKYGMKAALEASARRNPSAIYRRVVWQLVNTLETGADMRSSMRSLIEDLRRRQDEEGERYGRMVERLMAFYVMGGIVLPALSVVLLHTLSSIGASGALGEKAYWLVLASSVAVQVAFVYAMRFGKPAILGDVMTSPPGGAGILSHLKSVVSYAGVGSGWRAYLLSQALFAVAVGFASAILLKPWVPLDYALLSAATIIIAFATLYARLAYLAESRGLKASEDLPDTLRIMASNMDAGISTDQALLMSAKPEFGVLGGEMKLIGTDLLKNMTLEEALARLKGRIRSEQLHMSVDLICHGVRAGKGLSKSLHHIAAVLDDRERARRALSSRLSSVKSLAVLMVVAAAPMLYGTSVVAASVMGELNAKVGSALPSEVAAQGWLRPGGQGVSADFLHGYTLVNIMLAAFLGSVVVGQAASGRLGSGLRYSVTMVLLSELLYLAFKGFLEGRISVAFN